MIWAYMPEITDGERIAEAIKESKKTPEQKKAEEWDEYYYWHPPYCRQCGKKNIEVPTGKFGPRTGNPIVTMECPSNICTDGRSHEWKFWTGICKKCGVNGHTVHSMGGR